MKEKETIVNLTPHPVVVAGVTIPSTGVVRLEEKSEDAGVIAGIPIVKKKFGIPQGLPDEEEGIYIIVSRLVFDALPYRSDLLAIGDAIRDGEGRIVGAGNLVSHYL